MQIFDDEDSPPIYGPFYGQAVDPKHSPMKKLVLSKMKRIAELEKTIKIEEIKRKLKERPNFGYWAKQGIKASARELQNLLHNRPPLFPTEASSSSIPDSKINKFHQMQRRRQQQKQEKPARRQSQKDKKRINPYVSDGEYIIGNGPPTYKVVA